MTEFRGGPTGLRTKFIKFRSLNSVNPLLQAAGLRNSSFSTPAPVITSYNMYVIIITYILAPLFLPLIFYFFFFSTGKKLETVSFFVLCNFLLKNNIELYFIFFQITFLLTLFYFSDSMDADVGPFFW